MNRFARMVGLGAYCKEFNLITTLRGKTTVGNESAAQDQTELLDAISTTIEELSCLRLSFQAKQLVECLRQLHGLGENAQSDWQQKLEQNTIVQDYYALLNVSRTASITEIRKAYYRAARNHHPDKVGSNLSDDHMANLNDAARELLDEEHRADYDVLLANFENKSSTRLGEAAYYIRIT